MKRAYLLYGGNMGQSQVLFESATQILKRHLGRLYRKSSVYRSSAWGYASDNDFLNQLVVFETGLMADRVLQICLETEKKLGRKRFPGKGYSDRTIDIDLLYLDNLIISGDELTLPHPRLHERLFALLPLCEVIPEFIHPVLQKSNKSLLSLCSDKTAIEKLD